MNIDHTTLRKYIGNQSGDAAQAAYNRKRAINGAPTRSTPQTGFRKKLAPLVLSGTLTRAESAELFQVSGDPNALRLKVGDLIKAGKMTREQARDLLSP